jgi:hypothetical protein
MGRWLRIDLPRAILERLSVLRLKACSGQLDHERPLSATTGLMQCNKRGARFCNDR